MSIASRKIMAKSVTENSFFLGFFIFATGLNNAGGPMCLFHTRSLFLGPVISRAGKPARENGGREITDFFLQPAVHIFLPS
jgi:hypothetical protein